ncbi:MAG: NAD-dependent dehydratase [Candidatus Edwardsbacteria bacterium RIFOXYD12_FULL_50_11]|jgi:dTDP-glucose 4,6-dehydratase|uniref:UDP-glucuronate decarboxylase n=1 Tax=Candidatus Edwardsbacteria bacterium GWF2_54_11 TaxID=1817851 RepID=A0A1F5RHD1_9BACT|nr:MAG: NAD-dependent dehydratase [Candidatus Edwardsbacteria bacterium RifOxyC12_full_54_24]OGF07120.1 MAG: NAD-dependent dehydratase [Candidatus Edwardsbacteria bacterium RifOxyA12_full_54_48]OGF10914.1 MAG: NAD-dependent dehydratase [Candidatus Edwardsbacteria bacterium GWE2_54_12]OGF13553.1 MAG: NAD-dependent dehydratase [Candidatus Edwardsbacteria bacterium GWF2_54_11]OGF15860.1 MAG: NAD-dependent dehydratase [Candidatus Edwardsbacteria bacterium RIFOXYD12_FULL_50_11]OGJ17409.1 MAG: NAD-d
MRLLVAGGAGFLGSHLCDRLLSDRHQVTALDNLITGSLENISHLRGNKDFSFIEQDVTQPFKIEGKIDFILDLASPASPIDFVKIPMEILLVGSYGVHNLLELAREKQAGFLLTSTSEVYGDPLVHPQSEEYWGNVNPIGPRSVYDESKRYAEALTMAYHRYRSIDTRIVRIFNTYGPRMRLDDGRVVPTLIDQALNNRPLTVFGDGSQTRSFCYASDLIEGIYLTIKSSEHQPINLGNPQEMSILEFARAIKKYTGTGSAIEHQPLPADDPKVRRPDIGRARKILNWEPQIGFEAGIKKTIDWFAAKK